jgi:PGF-pre-PGF domain-containing protein
LRKPLTLGIIFLLVTSTLLTPIPTLHINAQDIKQHSLVLVVVASNIYDSIQTELSQYLHDLKNEGFITEVINYGGTSPIELRNIIRSYNPDGLFFIGDLPIAWFEILKIDESKPERPLIREVFPTDYFYMDLDGVWLDNDNNGYFDEHTGNVGPEVFLGRLKTSNMDLIGDEVSIAKDYLKRVHAYKTGLMATENKLLVYWPEEAASLRIYLDSLPKIYETVNIVEYPEGSEEDLKQKLLEGYQFVILGGRGHSWSSFISMENDKLYNSEVVATNPQSQFYVLYSCDNSRYTDPNFIAGCFAYTGKGLVTIGTSKGGGGIPPSRPANIVFESLTYGESFGVAIKKLFENITALESPGRYEYYSTVLIGDPTLKIMPRKFVSPKTIIVPDDHRTIQEAVYASHPGDSIYVKAGVYYENVIINKPVLLFGESPITTIIDGGEVGSAIKVQANNVVIANFTIRNSDRGLWLVVAGNVTVQNNNIIDNEHGIFISGGSNNIINGNNITNNRCGIYLEFAVNNIIYHNSFINNSQAVRGFMMYTNVWDNGYPSGGNCWSDYKGIDEKSGPNQDQLGSDGIGDTPYIIDANNEDRYPLMMPAVSVLSSITCLVSPSEIALGSPVTISGSISPPHVAIVTIEVSKNGGVTWDMLTTTTSLTDGSYRYTWIPPEAITYKIRASWPGDADHYRATSSAATLHVTLLIIPPVKTTIEKLEKGMPTVINLHAMEPRLSFHSLNVTTNVTITHATLTVEELVTKPREAPLPPHTLYKCVNITTNIEPTATIAVTVDFKVEQSWIKKNNINKTTVVLLRFHESEWKALPTSFMREDADFAYYQAHSPSLSLFAIVGEKIAPSKPAEFKLSNLSISPAEVGTGEKVVIAVDIANIGGQTGTYTVTLKMNGIVEATRSVSLAGGASTKVAFEVVKNIAGTYTVEVDGLTGSFIVKALPKPAEFTVSELKVSPAKVRVGEEASVSVKVTNNGEQTGSYTVELKVAGIVVDSRTVILKGGESTVITFIWKGKESGVYDVDVAGLKESISVVAPPPAPTPVTVYAIAVIAVIVAIVIIGITIKKKR